MDKRISVETIVVGDLQANCYIIRDARTNDAVLIDPGAEADKIKRAIIESGASLKAVVLTHGHFDHLAEADEFNVPVYVHRDDAAFLYDSEKNLALNFGVKKVFNSDFKTLTEDDRIPLGDMEISILHTPGHTPGSICLKINGMLFSGDTLFWHGIGRTDLPGGSYEDIIGSIKEKLLVLDDNVDVFPGHGLATSIGEEKRKNNFLWD